MAQAAPLVDHIPFRLELWLGFLALVATLLFLDLFFHRHARVIRAREAFLWTLFWIGLALSFNIWIYFHFGEAWGREFGKVKALEFLTGYLIEEALSIDNLFVFVVIFRH